MATLDLTCVTIRPLGPDDSLEELTELLHRAYRKLAEMGLKYLATHQTVDITRKRISHSKCFVAVYDGRIVGTINYNPKETAHGSPWYERPDVAKLTQMGVEPELHGCGLGRMLMDHAEAAARADGAAELAMDTAETAHHLIEWYARRGYRFIEYVDWDVTNYRSVVMSKTL